MSTKNDVVVKLALVFFVSLLSFAIGTFVGKKYSDNQYKLTMMEPSEHGSASREVASLHDETEVKSSTVSDDDIAKIAAEFADDENTDREPASKEVKHGADPHKETAEHDEEPAAAHPAAANSHDAPPAKAPASTTKETHAAKEVSGSKDTKAAMDAYAATKEASVAPSKAAQIVSGLKEAEKVAEVKKTAEAKLPKDVAQYSIGKFTLQIASMATEDEAKKKAETLKAKGYGAFYVPATVKGQTRFRVNVGLFTTEDEAKVYKTSFVEKNTDAKDSIVQKLAN